MSNRRSVNRRMFWRILRRLLGANRGRLIVMLLALGAGAAVTAALLNLQVDAKRRLTSEFRRFGANVIITPRDREPGQNFATLPEMLMDELPPTQASGAVARAGFLYATGEITVYSGEGIQATRLGSGPAVIAGYQYRADDLGQVVPYRKTEGNNVVIVDANTCQIGEGVANKFHVHATGVANLRVGKVEDGCVISEVRSFGGTEDNQIFVGLETAEKLTGVKGQLSLIQLSVPGTPKQIEEYIATVQSQFPDVDVRPIRQFTEGEAKIYNRISGLLTATVGIVLLLTALCVMAAMTNVAMERKMDVGLMKAIGGATRRVIRLFLAEAALLGLVGGLIGAAVGIFLSIGLGKAVFGVAARPRLIVYPVAVVLTVLVAILSAFPLRRLASLRPTSVFRGEA